jgi:NAD(P)-dependent dehydrogenase (short-subunit alcohol dehydrogenase family)
VIEKPVGGRDPSALRLRDPALDGRPLLQGRCIILTGAAGGIGRSMAEAFVCAGATLAATDLAGGPLDELLAEIRPVTPATHYAAAKGGVIALTKSLAHEAGEFGVRVNAISPGPTDTIALGANTAGKRRAAGSRTLFGRLGRPEEIAYSALFLLSDLATFVTGQVLGVNGGSRL